MAQIEHFDGAGVLAAARAAARGGDIRGAVDSYRTVVRDCARSGLRYPPGCPKPTALLLECDRSEDVLEIEASAVLSEDLANFDNDFATSKNVLLFKRELQRHWIDRNGIDRETLYLGEDWTVNIGHIGTIQYLVKLKELGLSGWKRIVVVSRPQSVINVPLLEQFGGHVEHVCDPEAVKQMAPIVIGAGLRHYDVVSLNDEPPLFVAESFNVIETAWVQSGRAPVLTLTPEQLKEARALIGALGVPPDRRYISLHVRESGFFGDAYNPQRTAAIEDYVSVMQLAADRGDWVVRMGDPSMSTMPELPGAIDYAHSAMKSAKLDMYLCALARFYVGTTSGLMFVPHAFGTRTLITNYSFVFAPPPFGSGARYIPKLITQYGETLPLARMMSEDVMRSSYLHANFSARGLAYVDNSREDIRLAAQEMYGGDPSLTREQQEIADSLPASWRDGSSTVGHSFIQQHFKPRETARRLAPLRSSWARWSAALRLR